jgi:hypothetical protein
MMEEIVVSSVLAGAVLGAILGGVLTDRFGRRRLIIMAGIIFTASAVSTALAPTVGWLIAGRIVCGIAIGVASFISPMYIAELAPAKVRGALVAVNMLARRNLGHISPRPRRSSQSGRPSVAVVVRNVRKLELQMSGSNAFCGRSSMSGTSKQGLRMTKPIARDPIYRRRAFDAETIELCVL